jgi:predicted nucleotide-binding protein
MYSLFVSYQVGERNEGMFSMERNRFLEYTDNTISKLYRPLSIEAIECIKSWPCILMQEGRGQESAYIAQILNIDVSDTEINFQSITLPVEHELINDFIWKIRDELDIEQFEFSRNHWAIKNRDLFPILSKAGYVLDDTLTSKFDNKFLRLPSRSNLLSARNVISEWGHTEIDDFLLEAGVDSLVAGREVGSRRDRANAIIKFVFENPTAITAEKFLFSFFIINKTTSATKDVTAEVTNNGEPDLGIDSALTFPEVPKQKVDETTRKSPNRVFVVHGQNESARDEVVEFLSGVGLIGIVLHEQPNMGRHLLTKFIEEAELVTFAIVLMTDDDVGGLKGDKLAPRSRQNVILELGYFLSHLGQSRICALVTPGLETPSDFDGIVYIKMDDDGRWKTELKRELQAAEMPLNG